MTRTATATATAAASRRQGARRHRRRRQLRLARSCRASSTTATPRDDEFVPGLMHVNLGGYHVRDIEFVAAFDIDEDKVGKDLSRGDLQRPEQHDQVRRRAAHGRARCTAA